MGALLKAALVWGISTAFVKILSALGIGFLTFKGLTALIDQSLAYLQGAVTNIGVDLFQILAMAGVFEGMSIIASAMTSIAAIKAAKVFLGVNQ